MLLLLAAANPSEKLSKIPPDFWWKAGLALVAVIAVVVILRKVAQMNKVVLAVLVFLGLAILAVTWIYERNEPAFLTPLIDQIAPFFPSKGK